MTALSCGSGCGVEGCCVTSYNMLCYNIPVTTPHCHEFVVFNCSQQRLGATQAEIQEKIHDRVKQMEELKQAVDALKVYLDVKYVM